MTHRNQKGFSQKHGAHAQIDPSIGKFISKRLKKGALPCAVAFSIVRTLSVSPEEVGKTADLMDIRIVKCQLGLFGYHHRKSVTPVMSSVSSALKNAIEKDLENGCLSCRSAWRLAQELGCHKLLISAACNTLGIKIRQCQLGAF